MKKEQPIYNVSAHMRSDRAQALRTFIAAAYPRFCRICARIDEYISFRVGGYDASGLEHIVEVSYSPIKKSLELKRVGSAVSINEKNYCFDKAEPKTLKTEYNHDGIDCWHKNALAVYLCKQGIAAKLSAIEEELNNMVVDIMEEG